ncbi:type II toxin-antitoxin system death-on-curing family toxin [Cereibacter sp. SYSU M97828]|nr:type II toxin-antitoxin system death-on-curing family toxin [Cereibacter flavus]
MTEPVWVPLRAILMIHDRQIEQHGGATGMRDQTLLEAGIQRPVNLAAYGEPTIAELAAAYAFGIAKAHAFIDGNKRTAFVTAFTFLRLNGFVFRPEPKEGVRMIEDLASSDVSEAQFADWIHTGSNRL